MKGKDMLLWLKALHVIAMVCWFAGLFYLPRLFVYHAMTHEEAVKNQFKIMEHKLYYYITTPAAILTIFFGLCLWLPQYDFYRHALWLHVKLISVLGLITFHIYCGILLHDFKQNKNKHPHKFYRYFNEIPTLALLIIIIMTILKP
jgi:putative membrane protein